MQIMGDVKKCNSGNQSHYDELPVLVFSGWAGLRLPAEIDKELPQWGLKPQV